MPRCCLPVIAALASQETLPTASYLCAFNFAHLARCAAAMLARPAALIFRVGFFASTTAVPLIFAHLALAAAPIRARAAGLIFLLSLGVGVAGGVDDGVNDGAGDGAVVPGCAKTPVISLIWVSMTARS